MENFRFIYQGKEYDLTEENCQYLLNDEEKPVKGFAIRDTLQLLKEHEDVAFSLEYYDEPCEKCSMGKKEKAGYFSFLEYHFFIFTKKEQYIISDISREYENLSYNKLLGSGKADDSYIVSIRVCVACGAYDVEISQCEV